MTHEEALNLILAHNCSNGTKEDGTIVFKLDLHCATATVVAELVSTYKTIQYKIHSVEVV